MAESRTSIKGHSSVTDMRKMMLNHPNLHLININGEILSICSKDIEQNESLTSIKGHNSVTNK